MYVQQQTDAGKAEVSRYVNVVQTASKQAVCSQPEKKKKKEYLCARAHVRSHAHASPWKPRSVAKQTTEQGGGGRLLQEANKTQRYNQDKYFVSSSDSKHHTPPLYIST